MDRDNPLIGRHLSNNEANRITRESISTALLYLMEQKPFEKITISELTKRAGVSRQAFYRNYQTLEDVVIEVEESLLDFFASTLSDLKYKNNVRLWITDFFRFVKDNKDLVSILYKAKLFDILFAKAPFVVDEYLSDGSSRQHFFIAGGLGMVRFIGEAWFDSGMKQSCEEMADICMECSLPLLERSFGE